MFSAAQIEPKTRQAALFALLMLLAVQAGYMILDLALRKLAAGRVNSALLYAVTWTLLGLATYVGVAVSCTRYPLADRALILWSVVALAIIMGAAGLALKGADMALAARAAIQAAYVAAQILGAAVATKVKRNPTWLPKA